MDFSQSLYTNEGDFKSPLSYLLQDSSFVTEENPSFLQNEKYLDNSSTNSPPNFVSSTETIESKDDSPLKDSIMFEDSTTEMQDIGSLENDVSKVRRRKRQPKNCSFCRRRKLKCNRQHPCSNCIKRNIESSCTYVADPNESNGNTDSILDSKHSDGFSSNPSSITTNRGLNNSTNIQATEQNVSRQTLLSDTQPFSGNSTFASTRPIATSASDTSPNIPSQSNGFLQPRLIPRKARNAPQASAIKFSDFSDLQEKQEDSEQATVLKKRLDKMEMLVLSMLQDKKSSDTSPSNTSPKSIDEKSTSPLEIIQREKYCNEVVVQNDLSKARESLGMLKLDKKGKSIYHGNTHWGALFCEIDLLEDLISKLTLSKNAAAKASKDESDESGVPLPPMDKEEVSVPFMCSGISKMTPLEVLSTIPSLSVCDTLIERYFSFCEPCFQLIHRPTFEREYKEFWDNPTGTELIWVSMFLGMLVLALQSYVPEDVPDQFRGNPKKFWSVWLEGAEVCAFSGKLIFKPGLNNVRSVIIWILTQAMHQSQCEWADSTTVSLSMAIRMCQSMGLHRDPKWFAMSICEAEQRRRIWSVVRYLDLYASMIQGMPVMISITGSDVDLPSNVNESDIMPEFEHQLVPYPMTTRTSTSYTIFRTRMVNWLAKVLHVSSAIGPDSSQISFEQVLDMHHMIRSCFLEAPEFLSTSVLKGHNENCSPDLLLQRVWYEIDYLRTLLVLHRYYGALGMENMKYRRSSEETLTASVRLLYLLEWCFESSEANVMHTLFDWVCNNFFMPHFLHSSVYICLVLIGQYDTFSVDQILEKIRLVELSLAIFTKLAKTMYRYESLAMILEGLVLKVRAVSELSVKEREERSKQEKSRSGSISSCNNIRSAINLTQHPLNRAMTMTLDTNDSIVRFDGFERRTGVSDIMTGFNSPSTPSTWAPLPQDDKAADNSTSTSHLMNDANIFLTEFDLLGQIPHFGSMQ